MIYDENFAPAQAHYNDLLKEAEEYRRYAHLNGGPNMFARALAALNSAFASKAKDSQPAAREAQPARKALATE